jgi:hypothetical protein
MGVRVNQVGLDINSTIRMHVEYSVSSPPIYYNPRLITVYKISHK